VAVGLRGSVAVYFCHVESASGGQNGEAMKLIKPAGGELRSASNS